MQSQLIDEDIDDSHRVVLRDVVVQALRKQRDLASLVALDESLHAVAAVSRCHN